MKFDDESEKALKKEAETDSGSFARLLLDTAWRDAQLKTTLLEIVKDTFEPEAESVDRFWTTSSCGKTSVAVEYLVWAHDSHTCVDFSEQCSIPLEWLRDGYDYKAAYRRTLAAECAQQLESARDASADLEERLAESRRDEKRLEEKLAKLEAGL